MNEFKIIHKAVSAFEKICEAIAAVRKLNDEEYQLLISMMEQYVKEGKK